MAIVVRYFSTAGAGAADGTTWADRAALFTTGNWSSVITGFDFSGSDSLVCRIGPGSYTCSQSLASALFANAPTVANPLYLVACDSSGNLISPPDPDWQSNMPAFSDATLPVIAATTNISTINLATAHFRLIKFTSSGRNGTALGAGSYDWCQLVQSTSNTSATGVFGIARCANCVVQMTGTAYDSGVGISPGLFDNIRIEGNASASSGNRRGVTWAVTAASASRLTATGHVGGGIVSTSTNTGHWIGLSNCTVANNPGSGIVGHSTASQSAQYVITNCQITGNGAYGIDCSASNVLIYGCRFRDNTSGNIATPGNYQDFGSYTTDSDDATEYVNSGAGDYRIKFAAATWGGGYGAGDQIPVAADFPTEAQVESGVDYGPNDEYTGELTGGSGGVIGGPNMRAGCMA